MILYCHSREGGNLKAFTAEGAEKYTDNISVDNTTINCYFSVVLRGLSGISFFDVWLRLIYL